MLTPEEKQAFNEKREAAFRESHPMQPNSTYTRLKYLFHESVSDDKGWKNTTYCLFKDKDGNILRTKEIKTLMYFAPADYSDLSLEQMLTSKRTGKKHLVTGYEYHIITGADGSAMQVHGNGLAVIRRGSKITAHKI